MHSKQYTKLMNAAKWREIRNAYLLEHPLCERCKAQGFVVSARCVHHIVPVESGKTMAEMERLAYNPANLKALCLKCHSEIHAADKSHTKAMVAKRNDERLAVWRDRMEKKFGLKTPGQSI